MARRIYTFGYEGLTVERFIARLQDAGVKHVVDVRAVPLSRKRGFSKTAFQEALRLAGIDYTHLVAMGCPKDVRDRYRADRDWQSYTLAFLEYLADQGDQLGRAATLTEAQPSCLVCFEADHNFCHRLFVARAISSRTGASIMHLGDRTTRVERPVSAVAA